MPYISNNARGRFNDLIDTLAERIENEGELAYCLYRLICDFDIVRPNTFATKNAIVGVIDNVKHEFQEMVLGPHEVEKRRVNGDIYDDHTSPSQLALVEERPDPEDQGPTPIGTGTLRTPERGGAR